MPAADRFLAPLISAWRGADSRMTDMCTPESDLDLFDDAVLQDPYAAYQQLRDAGPVVWMRATQMFAIPRFADVKEALRNWQVFSSAHGAAMNDPVNAAIAGNTLGSDPPLHGQLRGVLSRPLGPEAMRAITGQLEAEAEQLVAGLVARGHFDAATELAPHLPVTVISHLVGLPERGRERMLDWGQAAFNTLGPMNARCQGSFDIAMGLVNYAQTLARADLKPGGWAAQAFEAADRGEITEAQARGLLLDYVGPSLDTTILAITSAVWLFALHPEAWEALRANTGLLPQAINEVLRLESPIQVFSRYVVSDHEIEGCQLPAGSRAMVLYGSANRDERQWPEPERFDIGRKAAEQLAFGFGPHQCVGLPLARLEMRVVLAALLRRVRRFEIRDVQRELNNTLRGLKRCEVTVL